MDSVSGQVGVEHAGCRLGYCFNRRLGLRLGLLAGLGPEEARHLQRWQLGHRGQDRGFFRFLRNRSLIIIVQDEELLWFLVHEQAI